MKIVTGSLIENLPKIQALMEDHWKEVASHQDIRRLKPNTEAFRILEEKGKLLTLFVMDGDLIVGYSVNILVDHMHSDTLVAQNDAIYVDPAYRKSGAGIRLMKVTERAAKDCGAKLLFWHSKPDSRLDTVLDRLGYGVMDIIRSKEL